MIYSIMPSASTLAHPYGPPPIRSYGPPLSSVPSTVAAYNVNAKEFQPNAAMHVILPTNDALAQHLPGAKKKPNKKEGEPNKDVQEPKKNDMQQEGEKDLQETKKKGVQEVKKD